MPLEPLLAEPAAHLGVGLHEDPGLGAVDARVERALGADDAPVPSSVAVSSPKYQTLPQRSWA